MIYDYIVVGSGFGGSVSALRLAENLRTNSETLCAVSGAREKLNNGLAITSVFNPDPKTHIEIVKYPDRSNAMSHIPEKGTQPQQGAENTHFTHNQ